MSGETLQASVYFASQDRPNPWTPGHNSSSTGEVWLESYYERFTDGAFETSSQASDCF